MHWRRFVVSEIPKEAKAFDAWLQERWREKDALLEHYAQTGRFPADDGVDYAEVHNGAGVNHMVKGAGWIETHVQPKNTLEILQIFVPVASVFLLWKLAIRLWHWILIAVAE